MVQPYVLQFEWSSWLKGQFGENHSYIAQNVAASWNLPDFPQLYFGP